MSTREKFRKEIAVVAPEFEIINRAGVTRTKRTGTTVRELAVATFDPSANTAQRTEAAHGLGVFIPINAVITKAWYDVVTTFTSANDSATIALSVNSANDIVTAIAISDASNVWDAGRRDTKVDNPAISGESASALVTAAARAATWIKTTAVRELTATVATQALTAGKLNLYVEYVISD
jgi:hypothetical protein